MDLVGHRENETPGPANLSLNRSATKGAPLHYFLALPSADLKNWFVCEASRLTSPIFFGTYEDAQMVAYLKNKEYLDSITAQQPASFNAAQDYRPARQSHRRGLFVFNQLAKSGAQARS
jgi:hypothetical protein